MADSIPDDGWEELSPPVDDESVGWTGDLAALVLARLDTVVRVVQGVRGDLRREIEERDRRARRQRAVLALLAVVTLGTLGLAGVARHQSQETEKLQRQQEAAASQARVNACNRDNTFRAALLEARVSERAAIVAAVIQAIAAVTGEGRSPEQQAQVDRLVEVAVADANHRADAATAESLSKLAPRNCDPVYLNEQATSTTTTTVTGPQPGDPD